MKGRFAFLDRWYEGTKALARHPRATPALALVSFAESIIFPIPTAVMLVAMVQADKARAWRLAFIAGIFSVLGGLFGYALGWFAYESFAHPILESLGKVDSAEKFKTMADEYGAIAVFIGGLSPFPYKVITILSGALKISLPVFIVASLISRFAQYYLAAAIVWKFGDDAEYLLKEHFWKLTTAVLAVCIAGWFIYRSYSGH